MRNLIVFIIGIVVSFLVLANFSCTVPTNPRNDFNNAKILGVVAFQGTVSVNVNYECNVSLQLPELIDSITIKKHTISSYYVDREVTQSDTLVPFIYSISSTDSSKDVIIIAIKKKNGDKDTLFLPVVARIT